MLPDNHISHTMKKVSLQMIADSLGVSKCTVSLVLSGKSRDKRVSEELSRKIIAKAKELNYRPNELARGLRTGRTQTLGVIVADISNEFFANFIYHIQEHSRKYNYTVITTNMDENAGQFEEMSALLLNRRVDGIIAVPADGSFGSMKKIVDMNIPLVQIDRYFSDLEASCVVLDNYGAAFKTAERLVSEGCKRIAMIKHRNNSSVNIERANGFTDALKKAGIYDETLVKQIDYNTEEEDIRDAIADLTGKKEAVDGIFFMSHEMFITGVRYLFKEKVRIPEDVKVACFDKIEVFSILNFPLIYVEQPIKEMAEKAVDLLMSQIMDKKEVRKCVFDGKICLS